MDRKYKFGVSVRNYKTVSVVFYFGEPFKRFKGSRHEQKAESYAKYMEDKLKLNRRYFRMGAEDSIDRPKWGRRLMRKANVEDDGEIYHVVDNEHIALLANKNYKNESLNRLLKNIRYTEDDVYATLKKRDISFKDYDFYEFKHFGSSIPAVKINQTRYNGKHLQDMLRKLRANTEIRFSSQPNNVLMMEFNYGGEDYLMLLAPMVDTDDEGNRKVVEDSVDDLLIRKPKMEQDSDFDPEKADRNKDGELSDWEIAVGNAVAKGIREHKDKKGAEDSELFAPLQNDSIENELEIKIYVPSTRIDKRISVSEFQDRVDETKKFLSNMFGGFTSARNIGGYTSTMGDIIKEDIMIVSSWANRDDYKKNKSKLEEFIKQKKKDWEQETIGYEFENDFFMYAENNAPLHCRDCEGTGGLYDSYLGIDDECVSCEGTGVMEAETFEAHDDCVYCGKEITGEYKETSMYSDDIHREPLYGCSDCVNDGDYDVESKYSVDKLSKMSFREIDRKSGFLGDRLKYKFGVMDSWAELTKSERKEILNKIKKKESWLLREAETFEAQTVFTPQQVEDNKEWNERSKRGEFWKDLWWKKEGDRYSNHDDPNLYWNPNSPLANEFTEQKERFFKNSILPSKARPKPLETQEEKRAYNNLPPKEKNQIQTLGMYWRNVDYLKEGYGISEELAEILESSKMFGMYMNQMINPQMIKKYRTKILKALDSYNSKNPKETHITTTLSSHMKTRPVKGPRPAYDGRSSKPELGYFYSDYYDLPVPFMGYDYEDLSRFEAESFEAEEDEKRINGMTLDDWLDELDRIKATKEPFYYSNNILGSPKYDNMIDIFWEQGWTPQGILDAWESYDRQEGHWEKIRAETFEADYNDRGQKLCSRCRLSGYERPIYADGLCVPCIEELEDEHDEFSKRYEAETFEAPNPNCSICDGKGWKPFYGDPKQDAYLAKLFGLSIDELRLTPCDCRGAESFEAESIPYDFTKMPAIFKSWRRNTAYCINDGNENTLCGTGDRWSSRGHGNAGLDRITCQKCKSKWNKLTDEDIERIEEAWGRNGYIDSSWYSAETFEAEIKPTSYMVKSDAHKLKEASKRIHEQVELGEEYPEWWKSKLSVARNNTDNLADFLDYAVVENVFESEGDHDHEEIDELIDKLNTVVDFAITFIHDGGYGGEPKGVIIDDELGIKTEIVHYVEGSIQLHLVRDMETNELLSVRFSLTGDPEETPIVYLPLPEEITSVPEDDRVSATN